MRIAAPRGFGQCHVFSRNLLDTMPPLSRRSFVAGSAALIAAPAVAAASDLADVPVAIVGAGAAGIAAARRLQAAKVRFVLLEASNVVGGRCVTDTTTFGVPFDRGAHWIHRPSDNPLLKEARGPGIYPAPRGQKLRIPPRAARETELEQYLAALVRANRAIVDAGRAADRPASSDLPGDLGVWRDSVEFALGPYGVGRPLRDVSAADLARAAEHGADAFCRDGYGALLAKLAVGLPVHLSTPAQRLDWGAALRVDTPRGTVWARTVIVTVSTAALAGGALSFTPDLPKSYTDAVAALPLGEFENIALELPGNPFGLEADDVVFERASSERTAALLANIGGGTLSVVNVGGDFARGLSQSGEDAMTGFAIEWLSTVFGSDAKRYVKRAAATRWTDDTLIGGAFSIARPGRAAARRTLMTPLRDRVWFAGEAAHETLWGTVNGAWDSGTRAAEAAMRFIAGGEKASAKSGKKPKRNRRNRQ
jgi:monoamine oxidase